MKETHRLARLDAARQIGFRLAFVLLSSTIVVFFSEKVFWYPQGFVVGELILFYAFPVYACLWAIEHFRVCRLSGLILIAALFAFLIEGVLTTVIYEGGLFDPFMPAYFIGWHGLLSVVFGWYFLRKWLVRGQWPRIAVGSALFGLFWGIWSLTYWLPENVAEWKLLAAAGEVASGNTIWTAPEFALYAFAFTLLLGASHWLLGRGGWQTNFILTRAEKWFIVITLTALFATLVLPEIPLAIFKLAVMLGILAIGLRLNRRREAEGTLFLELGGPVKFSHLLSLLLMPVMATAVYALAYRYVPSEDFIRVFLQVIPPLQILLGGIMLLWALVAILRSRVAQPGPLAQS